MKKYFKERPIKIKYTGANASRESFILDNVLDFVKKRDENPFKKEKIKKKVKKERGNNNKWKI